MTEYFDTCGKEHTEKTLKIASSAANQLGIGEIVVATTSGESPVQLAGIFDGKIVAVTHAHGFKKGFTSELNSTLEEKMRRLNIDIVTGTHALSGVERALSKKAQGMYPAEIVANTLRMFGQGTKVCVECVIMAADAGKISGKPVVAVGGTGRGADTAMVISPAHASNMLDLRVNEILCKPVFYKER